MKENDHGMLQGIKNWYNEIFLLCKNIQVGIRCTSPMAMEMLYIWSGKAPMQMLWKTDVNI